MCACVWKRVWHMWRSEDNCRQSLTVWVLGVVRLDLIMLILTQQAPYWLNWSCFSFFPFLNYWSL